MVDPTPVGNNVGKAQEISPKLINWSICDLWPCDWLYICMWILLAFRLTTYISCSVSFPKIYWNKCSWQKCVMWINTTGRWFIAGRLIQSNGIKCVHVSIIRKLSQMTDLYLFIKYLLWICNHCSAYEWARLIVSPAFPCQSHDVLVLYLSCDSSC